MDPNATLKQIHEFLADRRSGEEVDIMCQDLWDWIETGGFQPEWERYPTGTSYYQCREVYLKRGERV